MTRSWFFVLQSGFSLISVTLMLLLEPQVFGPVITVLGSSAMAVLWVLWRRAAPPEGEGVD